MHGLIAYLKETENLTSSGGRHFLSLHTMYSTEPVIAVFAFPFTVTDCTKSTLLENCFTSTPNNGSLCCSSLPISLTPPVMVSKGFLLNLMVVGMGPPSGVVCE